MRFAQRLLANKFINPVTFIQQQQQKSATIYLKHVKWVTGRPQLEKYFNQFGQIKDVSLFFDPTTGLHRGFASITFTSSDGAERALNKRPHLVDGDEILVEQRLPMDNIKHAKFSTGKSQTIQGDQQQRQQIRPNRNRQGQQSQ